MECEKEELERDRKKQVGGGSTERGCQIVARVIEVAARVVMGVAMVIEVVAMLVATALLGSHSGCYGGCQVVIIVVVARVIEVVTRALLGQSWWLLW